MIFKCGDIKYITVTEHCLVLNVNVKSCDITYNTDAVIKFRGRR